MEAHVVSVVLPDRDAGLDVVSRVLAVVVVQDHGGRVTNHRNNARRDANEQPIVDALLGVGATVARLNDRDVPDLLVGFATPDGGRHTHLLEVKVAKKKLRPGQQNFKQWWAGVPIEVVRTPEDALRAIGLIVDDGAPGIWHYRWTTSSGSFDVHGTYPRGKQQ